MTTLYAPLSLTLTLSCLLYLLSLSLSSTCLCSFEAGDEVSNYFIDHFWFQTQSGSVFVSLSLPLSLSLEKRLLFYKPSLSSICVRDGDGDNDGDVISISVIGSLTLCSRRWYSILTLVLVSLRFGFYGCVFDFRFEFPSLSLSLSFFFFAGLASSLTTSS